MDEVNEFCCLPISQEAYKKILKSISEEQNIVLVARILAENSDYSLAESAAVANVEWDRLVNASEEQFPRKKQRHKE